MLMPSRLTNLPLMGDGLRGVVGKLVVDRLVLANEQVNLAVGGLQTDGQAARDAHLRAIGVLRALRAVVGVAGHVEDFPSNGDLAPILALAGHVGTSHEWKEGKSRASGEQNE